MLPGSNIQRHLCGCVREWAHEHRRIIPAVPNWGAITRSWVGMRDGAGEAGRRDRSPGRVPGEVGQLLGGFVEKKWRKWHFWERWKEIQSGNEISKPFHHNTSCILMTVYFFCKIAATLLKFWLCRSFHWMMWSEEAVTPVKSRPTFRGGTFQ